MKTFESIDFKPSKCRKELKELKHLLDTNDSLKERQDILPFFRKRHHLSVFVGSYIPNIISFDRLAFEYPIYGDFACDLAIGDSQTNTYCFVEFENATPNSIFQKQGKKATPEWSSRFEHGFSQVVDWFWKLDDMSRSTDFKSKFGADFVKYHGLLVLGRSHYLDYAEQQRLKWRLDRVLVNSKHIFCVTFDELYTDLDTRLKIYPDAYSADED